MQKTFKPRYPTRNAGFWFAVISLFLSYGLGGLLVIGILNNDPSRAPGNVDTGSIWIVIAVAVVIWLVSSYIVYRIMTTQPKQVTVDEQRLVVENVLTSPPVVEASIPFEAITMVQVADVPVEGGLFPASFKGLRLQWQLPVAAAQNQTLSSDQELTKTESDQNQTVTPDQEAIETAENEDVKKPLPQTGYEYVLSSRNVCDFDLLFDLVFERVPKSARGAKLFRAQN